MSSNEAPNLSALLASRRGPRLRGSARGRSGADGSRAKHSTAKDEAVRCTDHDAASSRLSCVEAGYLEDPYARLVSTQPLNRKLPLLNRGTYVRTTAIDLLVGKFITAPFKSTKQIISLGAGTDTRYFRLFDKYPDAHFTYHEVDFPANVKAKLTSIIRHPQLHSKLASPPTKTDVYHSPTYNLHPLDLRTLGVQTSSSLARASSSHLPNLDPSAPTLILSEMCLVYLPPSIVSSILSSLLTNHLQPQTPASLVLYEPILPDDAFGRTMAANLSARNIILHTLQAYPELGDQRARMKTYGLTSGADAADTEFIWRQWVDQEEKERVSRLEMLDEVEELDLLLRHYCVAWGWRDGEYEGGDSFSLMWKDIKGQASRG